MASGEAGAQVANDDMGSNLNMRRQPGSSGQFLAYLLEW
jgi:hypothetical protein